MVCFGLLLACGAASAQTGAERALLDGRVAEAERMLHESMSRSDQPQDHLLLCRALYAEDLFDAALPECEAAANAPQPTSAAFLWLGRVQGARAARANPIVAFAIARKVHAAFIRAVQLDPGSDAAIGDLGEYFVEAPAIVGGGVDQARSLASSSMAKAPSAAHRVLGMADRHDNDAAGAEREFRGAVSTAQGNEVPGAWIDLAHFYQQQGRCDEALRAIQSAVANDPGRGPALVDAARLLTELRQPPERGVSLLRQYLQSANRSDAAPAFKVRYELATLLERAGDPAAAQQERAIAHSLVPDFVPHHGSAPTGAATEAGGQVR